MPAAPAHPRRAVLVRRALAGALVAVSLAGAASCSTPAPSQKDLAAAFVDSGLSKKVADCTASALTKSLTSAELAEITERGAGGAPVDDTKTTSDSADKLAKAMATCRDLQAEEAPSTTTTTLPIGSDPTASTTTVVEPSTDGAQLNPASTTTTP